MRSARPTVSFSSAFVALLAASVLSFLCCESRSQPPDGSPSVVDPKPADQATDPPKHSAEPSVPPAPERPSQTDQGIYSEYDPEVTVHLPSWVDQQEIRVVDGPGDGSLIAYIGQTPVGLATAKMGEPVHIGSWNDNDADKDGLPNGFDILLGAKKAAMNKAKYQGGYKGMTYPGGDVPRTEGVCTDVVVRALRNAGIDLQKKLHEDIKAHPKVYPMVDTPDPNIDQRRVRTLLPYFNTNWVSLPTDPTKQGTLLWAPGDVLFMNTMGDKRPDHVGIVSDKVGASGQPLVINNWSYGYHTQAMDLLNFVPVTHRFRVPSSPLDGPIEFDTVLQRHNIKLPDKHRQVLLIESRTVDGSTAQLRRFERPKHQHGWKQVGRTTAVMLGADGLGAGRGLYKTHLPGMTPKKEGDKRSPAGVFSLGAAFGTVDKPYEGKWPWRSVDGRDRWIDDPSSVDYNTWQRAATDGSPRRWASAEMLDTYQLGLIVEHNMNPVKAGAGSAIFLHTQARTAGATLGCTSMKAAELTQVLGWLKPAAYPVFVQLTKWPTQAARTD